MTDNLPASAPEPTGEIILYQTEDGANRIEVRPEGDTVWLSQRSEQDALGCAWTGRSRSDPPPGRRGTALYAADVVGCEHGRVHVPEQKGDC